MTPRGTQGAPGMERHGGDGRYPVLAFSEACTYLLHVEGAHYRTRAYTPHDRHRELRLCSDAQHADMRPYVIHVNGPLSLVPVLL